MFNRTMQVKFEKTKKNKTEPDPMEDEQHVKKLVYANAMSKDLIREGMKLVAFYVVLDTARKVMIARAER